MLKKINRHILVIITVFFCLPGFAGNPAKSDYWNTQRRGANIFNEELTEDVIAAAAKQNIYLLRIAPDKWKGKEKDFLIGNTDDYKKLVQEDLDKLKKILLLCDKYHIKVVLTMLSLPGSRWKQLNKDKDDLRIWKDQKYQKQAIKFWCDLAKELKGNPAIAGYNILNEPHPEVIGKYHSHSPKLEKWVKKSEGTNADMNLFYKNIVKAIREFDTETPIIIDSGLYADPRTFIYLKPLEDNNVIYAFHMYEPYEYTNKKLNAGKFAYPGKIKTGNEIINFNKDKLQDLYINPIIKWQKRYNIPSKKIFAEEFGGNRTSKGLENYFSDLTGIFNNHGWHWCFYSFREDGWDGMNYELGSKPLPWKYWQDIEAGKKTELKYDDTNPIWTIIQKALKTEKDSL